jgi:hypothetical protein
MLTAEKQGRYRCYCAEASAVRIAAAIRLPSRATRMSRTPSYYNAVCPGQAERYCQRSAAREALAPSRRDSRRDGPQTNGPA